MRQTATNNPQFATRPSRSAAVWVALLLLGVSLLGTGGDPFISDGEVMLLTAARIVDARTFTLPPGAEGYPQTIVREDGYVFSRYGLGQPFAAAPLYALGRYGLGRVLPLGDNAYYVGRFVALLLPAFATALAAGLLCVWAARLYGSQRMGAALALLFGFGTLAWPYSRVFFSEALFTACLVLAALALYTRRPLLGGLAFGYAVLTRVGGVVLLPAFVLYLWLQHVDDGRRTTDDSSANVFPRRSLRLRSGQASSIGCSTLWFFAGMLPFAALILFHNWVRFRGLGEQGYGNEGFTGDVLVGLYGLLLSPGKSVFLYVPLFLALPFALVPFARRFGREAALVGALTLIQLGQSALWWIWWAGWGWGPRFLVPLMPFWVLMLGILLQRPIWRLVIWLTLFPMSVLVNLLGILVDFNTYLAEITQGDMAREAMYLYQPQYAPILAHIQRLDLGNLPIVSFALDSPNVGIPQPWANVISISFVALVAIGMLGLWRSLRNADASSGVRTA